MTLWQVVIVIQEMREGNMYYGAFFDVLFDMEERSWKLKKVFSAGKNDVYFLTQ